MIENIGRVPGEVIQDELIEDFMVIEPHQPFGFSSSIGMMGNINPSISSSSFRPSMMASPSLWGSKDLFEEEERFLKDVLSGESMLGRGRGASRRYEDQKWKERIEKLKKRTASYSTYAQMRRQDEQKRKRELKEIEKKRIQTLKINSLKTHWVDDAGLQLGKASSKTMTQFKKKF